MNLSKKVSETIAKSIEESPFSVRQFSQAVGISENTIHKIIKGQQDIKLTTLEQIAKVLGKSVHYLLSPNASIFIDADQDSATFEIDIDDMTEKMNDLKQRILDKQTIVEYLNSKDKANQEVLISVLNLLSNSKNKPCKEVLAEIKKIKKVEFLIEYGLINPEIFK